MKAVRWIVFSVLCVLVPASTVAAEASACSIRPVTLRCEYLEDPLGIDVPRPRLSWQLAAADPTARGQGQTAYQVVVLWQDPSLQGNDEVVWDSGMVDSDRCVNVVYAGEPLYAGMVYIWKVRVKDEKGVVSAWSEPARWTVGPLGKADWWSHKWIGGHKVFSRKEGWPPPDNDVPDPWVRKTFQLERKPERAVIYVASVGYHELYVNNKKVGDAILSPSVANHRKRARYVTYDISDYLEEGRNAIGFWLGVSWSIFPPYKTDSRPQTPIVMAEARITMPPNGQVKVISTDETWRTRPSANTLLGIWDFMHFGGESYDADKEVPGWCHPDYDDSSWPVAKVYEPNLVVSAEMVEPNRKIREIEPVMIQMVRPDVYRVDLGVNVTGWFEMDVHGKPGDVIEMKFSERSDKEMTHRLHSRYIIGPSGKGTFRNHFNYFTGRWVQIEGLY